MKVENQCPLELVTVCLIYIEPGEATSRYPGYINSSLTVHYKTMNSSMAMGRVGFAPIEEQPETSQQSFKPNNIKHRAQTSVKHVYSTKPMAMVKPTTASVNYKSKKPRTIHEELNFIRGSGSESVKRELGGESFSQDIIVDNNSIFKTSRKYFLPSL